MRTRAPAVLALSMSALLCGCSILGNPPSPKSTYIDSSGETVTVDWKLYPAGAGVDGEALMDEPDQAELEAPARELMQRLRDAIETSSGVTLTPTQPEQSWFDDENWYGYGGNGYGGESMLVTVNCCRLESERVPDHDQWRAIVDAASLVTEEAGMGPLGLDHESEQMTADPAWREEYHERFCNAGGGACWLWLAVASDGVQWVSLELQDGSLDPTGDAAREAEDTDQPLTLLAIDYGATVVRAGMKDEYEDAIAPFVGLEQPEPTTSD